jgi:hypothetical protein
MAPGAAYAPLKPRERVQIIASCLVLVVFGVVILIRSCFLESRLTDVGCYLRAGWAVRAGKDPYAVTDIHYWHFAYPPAAALMFVPLADAPPGVDRAWMLPQAVSVVLWFAFNVVCILLAAHWIASTLERNSKDPALRDMPAYCRRWWFNRLFPIWICMVQLGSTLSRGQVTPLLILCMAGIFKAAVERKSLRSGLWLATAICVKIVPAFLILFPLWRRDWRALAGTAAGLFVGAALIPSLVWGVPGAITMHQRMLDAIIVPAMSDGGDRTRAGELTDINGTDHQSIGAVLHNYQYWGKLDKRPAQPEAWVRLGHWAIGGLLTALALWAVGWRRDDDALRMLLFLGTLFLLMVLISPLSHLHYFAMALPLVMGLHAVGLESDDKLMPRWPQSVVLILAGIGYAVPTVLTNWEARREAGLPLLVSLMLWSFALWHLRDNKAPHRLPSLALGLGRHEFPAATGRQFSS